MEMQEVRDSRLSGAVAYTRLCEEYRYTTASMFCFFEGEDRKYYLPRIIRYANVENVSINSYSCKGKSEVLRAYHLVKRDRTISHLKTAFFVDRDFSDDSLQYDEVYQTPCYSIENFYTSISAFKRVLITEFGINHADCDFNQCCQDYEKRKGEFHNVIKYINAWMLCIRENERICNHPRNRFDGFKIRQLFSTIEIDEITSSQPISTELLNTLLPNSYNIDMQSDQYTDALKRFHFPDGQNMYRGKSELEFLRCMINSLKKKNNERMYFSVYRDCIRVDADANPLSSLSNYADTPHCLIDFLGQYHTAAAVS